MFGVGAVIGAGPVTIAFFLAPFFGIVLAVYRMIIRSKQELPYGPYLSLGTAAVMLFYCPIAEYFRPGMEAIAYFLTGADVGP
jgi:prepilin signal peptidase PulO-like enzyme (type II secretory pathway)